MPVPIRRGRNETTCAIKAFLRARGAEDISIGNLTIPENGFSSEIILFEGRWTLGDHSGRAGTKVLRVSPSGHRLFPGDSFDTEVHTQRILGDAGLPLPRLLFAESALGYFGAPFTIVEHVAGSVPRDLPSYHREGWLHDLGVDRRRKVWFDAVYALAEVHTVPNLLPTPIGAGINVGAVGDQIAYLREHAEFFGVDVTAPGTYRTALAWLEANAPDLPPPSTLIWGDARLGNIVFGDDGVAALLDWEMAGRGYPESDVAWFLHMDRHLSEGIGADRLAGLPTADDTIRAYEGRTGRAVRHLPYFQVLVAVAFGVVTARVVTLLHQSRIVAPHGEFPLHHNATRLLERILREADARAL